jgi:hypothetical protein
VSEAEIAVDKDGDGDITFLELAKVMYPKTPVARLETLCKSVSDDAGHVLTRQLEPQKKEEAPKKKELTQSQLDEIRAIFTLYDKDGSGEIEIEELVEALGATGLRGVES